MSKSTIPPEWVYLSDFYVEFEFCIHQKFNIFLYGANGIGKTKLVKQIFSSIAYGYVDCIGSSKQREISKHLCTTLIGNYPRNGYEIPGSFHEVIKEVKRNMIVKKRIHYLVFDNVNRILHRKLFRKILSMGHNLKNYIRIVMICNGCLPKLKYFHEFSISDEQFIPILMPPPDGECLKIILRDSIHEVMQPEIYSLLIDLLYNEYSKYTTDIHCYIYICRMVMPILFKGVESRDVKKEEFPKLYNRRMGKVGQWLISNFFTPIWDYKEIDNEDNYYDDFIDLHNNVHSIKYSGTIKYGLSYLQGMLIIATYLACHNPEHTDKRFFFNNKRKIKLPKKVKMTKTLVKWIMKGGSKKVELERIVAIADYFLSAMDNKTFEYRSVNHTLEFNSQLNDLAKRGYIQIIAKRNNSEKVYYLSSTEHVIIEEIADCLDIKLFEYLCKDII